jgi:SAM-dependent methyltransferase
VVPDEDVTDQVGRVRSYYDRNTARFRRLGQGGASIHRAVHGPGVTTREQAFHHVEERILALVPVARPDGGPPRVVDLGCGVGGSLLHLAGRRADLVADGITISPAQVAVAAELVEEAGLADRVRVREGDFLAPPADLAGADLVLSVEAFVHGPDPAAYFRAAAGLLRPGGLLVLCDDLLAPRGVRPSPRDSRRLDEFRTGWRVGSLVTADAAARDAAAAGLDLVTDDDLTPYLGLRRPRDRWISLMVAATRPLRPTGEYWASLAGGSALQHCLATGLVEYRLLVLRRPAAGD